MKDIPRDSVVRVERETPAAILAFAPEVNSPKATSPNADWAIVDLLTEEILPEGVYVETRFVRNGQIKVLGYADSNRVVAEYLRAILAEGGHGP